MFTSTPPTICPLHDPSTICPSVGTPTSTTKRGRPSVGELDHWDLPADRMWKIEDVAAFLGFSVRLTENIVKDPRVPQPRFVSKGGDRRWSPTHWHTWMADDDTNYHRDLQDGTPTAGSGDRPEMGVV